MSSNSATRTDGLLIAVDINLVVIGEEIENLVVGRGTAFMELARFRPR